jgi:Protein of unknown function (DUF3179)
MTASYSTDSQALDRHPLYRGDTKRPASPWLWTAFSVSALAASALFFIPALIIRPFRHQAPRALLLAMALRQRAPLGTLIAAVACFALAYALWKNTARLGKSLVSVTLLVVTFSAVMSRLNYFEWMFHPIDGPQFLAQSTSKLDPAEMIMAVRLDSDARAYPISQMAYHHVLNDVVAGVPIAVTY